MTETARIKDQLQRAFSGDAWYGSSLIEILADVSAKKAAAHLFPNALSIWELVLHLTFTEEIMLRRIEGEQAAISGDEDFPKVFDSSEAAWQNALEKLQASHEKLKNAIDKLENEKLDEKLKTYDHSKYHLLHGLIQHLVYHAGQIALLKKFLNSANDPKIV